MIKYTPLKRGEIKMLDVEAYLYNSLKQSCPEIHMTRLNAVMDVASGLRQSQNLSLSEMGTGRFHQSLKLNLYFSF